MVASTKHYWYSVKLLSVPLTCLFLLGNTMKCLQPCVTHVFRDTATSSSISKTHPSLVCEAFSFLTVSNKAGVSSCQLVYWVLGKLTKNRAGVSWIKPLRSLKIEHNFMHFKVYLYLMKYLKNASCWQHLSPTWEILTSALYSVCNRHLLSFSSRTLQVSAGSQLTQQYIVLYNYMVSSDTKHLGHWNLWWKKRPLGIFLSSYWWATVQNQRIDEWQSLKRKSISTTITTPHIVNTPWNDAWPTK